MFECFTLQLVSSQLAVFDANLTTPFNEWDEASFVKAIAWRPSSVSFRLPISTGLLDVSVGLTDMIAPDAKAEWALLVPFTTWSGDVVISSLAQEKVFEVSPGHYGLLFESGGFGHGQPWSRVGLMASPMVAVEARVLRPRMARLAKASGSRLSSTSVIHLRYHAE